MKRTIGSTKCRFCNDLVLKIEYDRPIKLVDCSPCLFVQYEGMLVAEAKCINCNAHYLAWLKGKDNSYPTGTMSKSPCDGGCGGFGGYEIKDLSHIHSFNSIPDKEDFPRVMREHFHLSCNCIDCKRFRGDDKNPSIPNINGIWRQGNKLGRTLYIDDVCIGMVDTPEIAKAIVDRMNRG